MKQSIGIKELSTRDQLPLAILLSGDDAIGLAKAREQLVEKLHGFYGEIHEEYYDSTVEEFDGFLNRIMTPTLFGEFRLFHINHLQKLSVKELDHIAEVLAYPIDNVLILLEYAKDSKKKIPEKLKMKKLQKEGVALSLAFKKPRQYEMNQWLISQVKSLFQRKIDDNASEQLLNFAGFELDRIYSELQKLDIYLPDGSAITTDAIEVVTGSSKVMKPDELCNAMGYRKWGEVLTILEYLLSANRYSIFQLINALLRHFWGLYKIRTFAEENRASANRYFKTSYKEKTAIAGDIAVSAGLIGESQRNRVYPAIIIPGLIDQAVKFSRDEISRIICELVAYDRALKNGLEKQDIGSFTHFCYRLIRTGKIDAA